LRENQGALEKANAQVVTIGTGDLSYARDFKQKFTVPFPVLVDDDLLSYRAVGAGEGSYLDWASPMMLKASLKAARSGATQGKIGKHGLFLGATHVIRPDRTVPYAWVNADFQDDAPLDDVIAALLSA
jgi:peroxiredoxin